MVGRVEMELAWQARAVAGKLLVRGGGRIPLAGSHRSGIWGALPGWVGRLP